MKDLKPTDPQYIEALALKRVDEIKYLNHEEAKYCLEDFSKGYQLALEHTGHEKLLEAAKKVMVYTDELTDEVITPSAQAIEAVNELCKAIQQSEANKLNQ